MPVELLMVRRGDALVPAHAQDEEDFFLVPTRRALTVSVTRTAPDKLKAWYRTLIGRIYDARPGDWPSRDQVHHAMLLRAGFFDRCIVSNGDVRFTAPSTKEWDALQWRAYLDALWPLVVNEIIPEIGDRRLRESIQAMIGLTLEDLA